MPKEKSSIEIAAENHVRNHGMVSYPDKYDSFIVGAISEAAREYWFEKFQLERYESDKNSLLYNTFIN